MVPDLVHEVLAANRALKTHGLVTLTWGNVSGIDRDRGIVAIKPSGVAYDALTVEEIVVLDLDGNVIAGEQAPVDGHAHAPRAVPRVRGHRRRRPHALDVRHRVGAGPA